ncbi:serine hydrolase [Devosia faecipullorum]|uniref:serine hydrolase n=1 Tax=Devosia faecipullorum TaxID=2755039 RepID=UPI00187B9D6B|nr:serine hydrolase [Devosia faecipullorum]MBE7732683.1 serine hydrolase [Devosia faecipullorum]
MTYAAALTLAALMILPAAAQEASLPDNADIAGILSDRIGRDQANVGIAVALIEGGETRFVSHGTMALDGAEPVDEHTIFEAGSITKLFTNLLLAQLVDKGRIDLDAPIADYLPEGFIMPQQGERPITAFDLATHRAGFSGLPEDVLAADLNNLYSGYNAEQLRAWLATYVPARPSGEGFEYSNIGTAILGLAIEEVSGLSYADLVKEAILTPLGMDETSLALTGTARPEMAMGHDGAREPASNWDFEVFAPAGALLTNSADLIKFIGAASGASPTPLQPAFETMLARTVPVSDGISIGLGWFITDTGQSEIVWHNGMTGGYSSFAGFDRESGNGVVVLTNMAARLGVNDIGMHLLNPAIPLNAQPKVRSAVEIDPALYRDYAGEYVLAPGAVLSVRAENGKLLAQLTGQQAFEIFPESESDFFYKIIDAQISFMREDGAVKSLVLYQNGQVMPALKLQ